MEPNFAGVVEIVPYVALIVMASVGGWVVTTWLRIKNGNPIENSWGKPMHPSSDRDSQERIKLLSSENAQLRAELGSVKDRLETIERIVTDEPARLSREIDQLHLVPTKKDIA